MKSLLERALTSSFLRGFTVLATGNLLAQAIPLLVLPILARIYDAKLFGAQAVLMVGVSFLIPLSTGFYEYAIPTPKSDKHARVLATTAFALSFLINLVVFLGLLFFGDTLALRLGWHQIGPWIYAFPLVSFAASMISLSNYWLLRLGKFHLQSLNKLVQASASALLMLALGLAHVQSGLTAGFVAGWTVTSLYALWKAGKLGMRFEFPSARYTWALMKKYAEFPIFGSIPSSINNLAVQVPVMIITAHYSLTMTGHYSVARNLLSGAVGLVSVCLGQVILKHFSDHIHAGRRLWPHYCRIAAFIFVLGIVGAGATALLGPWFFQLYLGAGWGDSGDIVRILAVNTLFWLLGPSLALAAIAIKKLRAIALWQCLHGVLAFGLTFFSHLPFETFVWRLVIFEAASYFLYFVIMTVTVRRYDQGQKTA